MAVNSATGSGASIDGMNFVVDPQSVHWDYSVKINTKKTVGGKVIQLLGFNMGDLIVQGQYPGHHTTWNQKKFLDRIIKIADEQVPIIGRPSPKPVRFMWPNMNWDFWVFVKDLKQDGASVAIERSNGAFSPNYTLTMFVYEDNGNIVEAIKTSTQVKFLQRITAGMGWSQTDWNGPMTIKEVTDLLAGRTVYEYITTPLPFTEYNDEGPEVFSTEGNSSANSNTDTNTSDTDDED